MSTSGSRFLITLSVFGVVAAVVYGLSTGGEFLGVLSAGYKAVSASMPGTRSCWPSPSAQASSVR